MASPAAAVNVSASNAPASSAAPVVAPREVDVVVIGGGPAGTTVAIELVRLGWSVVVAEKDHHPRFHIGESLLPMNLPLFERLGVADAVAAIGIRKHCAEFTSMEHGKTVRFDFGRAWDKSVPFAYQVRRADLDKILIDNARRKGVEVIEGCRVSEVVFDPSGRSVVRAQERARADESASGDAHALGRTRPDRDGARHEWHARFVVDATGRDTLLANQFKMKRRHPKHASSALYGHFRGARRHEGMHEGNISIYWFAHGWFWFIPLRDGTTSVGAVVWPYYMKTRKVDPSTFLMQTIAMCPPLAERLAGAELIAPATATGNYSYLADRTGGDGYLLVGDAFGFVDPVFSAGVYLAMVTGFEGAKAVDTILRDPARAPQALAAYDRLARHGIRNFSWFVFRMTSPSLRDMFMDPRNVFRIEESMLSLLAGDIFRNPGILRRLLVFKALYFSFNLFNVRRTYAAWKRRKHILQTAAD